MNYTFYINNVCLNLQTFVVVVCTDLFIEAPVYSDYLKGG